jgi:hypothetical protein
MQRQMRHNTLSSEITPYPNRIRGIKKELGLGVPEIMGKSRKWGASVAARDRKLGSLVGAGSIKGRVLCICIYKLIFNKIISFGFCS